MLMSLYNFAELGKGLTGMIDELYTNPWYVLHMEVKIVKKIISIILMCVVLVTLVGCRKQNEVVKDTAQTLIDAFHDSDMKTINKAIFGTTELEVDNELADMWDGTSESQGGILEYIFARVTLEVKNISEDTVEFEIEAPDMLNVFTNFKTDLDGITEDKLLQHIVDYAKSAETKTATVSLKYILVDEEAVLDYQDEAFINAITGGLLDAYKSLYSEMMEEYVKGGN